MKKSDWLFIPILSNSGILQRKFQFHFLLQEQGFQNEQPLRNEMLKFFVNWSERCER
jgi:hypothetical protein